MELDLIDSRTNKPLTTNKQASLQDKITERRKSLYLAKLQSAADALLMKAESANSSEDCNNWLGGIMQISCIAESIDDLFPKR